MKLTRAELDSLAAETIRKQTARIEALEEILKRSDKPPVLNDDAAAIARAPEVASAIEKAFNGPRDTGAQTVMRGRAALPQGAGNWAPVPVEGPIKKSRKQRDEDAHAEVVAKRRAKVHNDIHGGV